jgi:hypothetical protein
VRRFSNVGTECVERVSQGDEHHRRQQHEENVRIPRSVRVVDLDPTDGHEAKEGERRPGEAERAGVGVADGCGVTSDEQQEGHEDEHAHAGKSEGAIKGAGDGPPRVAHGLVRHRGPPGLRR